MMKRESLVSEVVFWLWAVVGLLAVFNIPFFLVQILRAPETLRIQYIPDDAFYCLTLVKNFVHFHNWTFDSGVSLTTGFHPLVYYLLLVIEIAFRPGLSSFITWSVTLSSLITFGGALGFWFLFVRQRNLVLLALLAVVITSRNFVQNSVSITEWALTVSVAAVYVHLLFVRDPVIRRSRLITIFLAGFAGELARSEFGLLPLCLFLAFGVRSWAHRRFENTIEAAVGLAGAGLGLGVLCLHNWVFTGQIVQSSALMKAFWAKDYLMSMRLVPGFFCRILAVVSPLYVRLVLIGVLVMVVGMALVLLAVEWRNRQTAAGRILLLSSGALLIVLWFGRVEAVQPWFNMSLMFALLISVSVLSTVVALIQCGTRDGRADLRRWDLGLTFLTGCILAVIGYCQMYRHVDAFQPWYTSTLLVPLFIVAASLTRFLLEGIEGRSRTLLNIVGCVPLFFVMGNIRQHYPLAPERSPWPPQRMMLVAGQFLAREALIGRVGSFNAGILGYYGGRRVVNLDGLVNNDIYRYATKGNLLTYLTEKEIRYVIDSALTLSSDKFCRGRGLDRSEFHRQYRAVKVFGERGLPGGDLSLFKKINETAEKRLPKSPPKNGSAGS